MGWMDEEDTWSGMGRVDEMTCDRMDEMSQINGMDEVGWGWMDVICKMGWMEQMDWMAEMGQVDQDGLDGINGQMGRMEGMEWDRIDEMEQV